MKHEQKKPKPNILFILVDDLGWKDLSCYGSEFYETPNIDKLAKEGVRFTSAYAASPLCSPTRASIMTGKHPGRLDTTQWFGSFRTKGKLISAESVQHLPLEEQSLAKTLKKDGYTTIHIGKWHLGKEPYSPKNHGFDYNIAGSHWGHPKRGFFSPYHMPNLKDGPKGEFLTDRLTNEAIKLLKQKSHSPFFLNLCYYAVHIPIQAPSSLIQKYKEKAKRLGLDKRTTFEKGENFSCIHKKYNKIIRRIIQSDPTYAAMIERLDWNIGRLLETLKDLHIEDNTIIIFFSDNGGLSSAESSPTCNSPLKEGKGWIYEGGNRVPMIIKWSKEWKYREASDIPVLSTDFYPTILEMIGNPSLPEQHLDGRSIIPYLRNLEGITEKPLYWHYPHYSNQGCTPSTSIRMGKHKLIQFYENDRFELYNLQEDIGEKKNLCEKQPEIAENLREKIANWKENVDAKLPKKNKNYNKIFADIKQKIIALGYWIYSKLTHR